MRWALLVLMLTCAGRAAAEPNSMDKAHERLLAKAVLDGVAQAKKLPELTPKGWAIVWRKKFDVLQRAVCRCPYSSPAITGHPNTCVVAAFDEFIVDMMVPTFRLPGIADTFKRAMDEDWPTKQIETTMQKATESALDEAVPTKEQLKRFAGLRQCMENVGVL